MQIQKDFITSSDLNAIKRDMLSELKAALADPARMRKFTKFMTSTHNYSLFNKWLIFHQFPEASQVMGEVAWKKNFDRTVKPGEQRIAILFPLMRSVSAIKKYKGDTSTGKDDNQKRLTGYGVTKVYDIAQTEGPEINLITEMGIKVDDPEELLQELVFNLSLDGYTIDLQAMGFKEASKVEDTKIHINKSLDLESKIVELLNVLSKIHLQHYSKRKDFPEEVKNTETKVVTTIISNILGKSVNVNINVDSIEDKSISMIFKAADSVAKSIGISLKNKK